MTKRHVDHDHLGNSYSPDLDGKRSLAIFAVERNWQLTEFQLPNLLVTEPTVESHAIEETTDLYDAPHGMRYPVLRFPYESPEPTGETARHFANSYYYEGFYTPCDPLHLGKRIDCFRMSELLFLHAIARGNRRAHVGLANIYYFDRCEGHYFQACKHDLYANAVLDAETVRRMAREHYQFGIEEGNPETCYMYGDMLRDGIGGPKDVVEALQLYHRAPEYCDAPDKAFTAAPGCVHVRLGRAYEEGEGCAYNFDTAYMHYQQAAKIMEKAVERVGLRYDADLARATRGVARMKQQRALAH